MNPIAILMGANTGELSQSRTSIWLWSLFTVACFVFGVLIWWPIAVIGIATLVFSEHQLHACVLGALLDSVYWVTAGNQHLVNLFGFPFLGTAIFLGIFFYIYKSIVRRGA